MSELWYALHVRPRFEKQVQLQLAGKGYEAFLPMYVSKRQWSDRVHSVTLPLFPGYVFCRFNIQSRLPILVTPGVKAVIGVGSCPVALDEMEIAAIRHVFESGMPMKPCPYISEGETIRVEEGPLQGLTGIVVKTKGADRLIVSLTLLMKSISVELNRNHVEPVKLRKRTNRIRVRNADFVEV